MLRSGLSLLKGYWLPAPVDRNAVAPRLAHFYSSRADYHTMTAREDKRGHPQVLLLVDLIKSTDRVVEFGCGGGVALSAAAEKAREGIGVDISAIALSKAIARPGCHNVIQADLASVPLASNSADLVYCFEVLEHVWNPATVIREMVRVVKPGGIVLLTTPNGYAMNLHLNLKRSVRLINHVGALVSFALALGRKDPFENTPPDLDAFPVYPDCDMITRLHPYSLLRFAGQIGCEVERLETFFMVREQSSVAADRERYVRLESNSFYHWHGDHILFLGRKTKSV